MKRRSKLKGMTLIEVVISIGVYAVIALLLTEVMSLVNATMKATNQLNRRLAYEAKFADNLLTHDGSDSFPRNGQESDPNGNEQARPSIVLTNHNAADAVKFNVQAEGDVYMVSPKNYERAHSGAEQNLIINPNTNYRFLVFTKTIGSFAEQKDYFNVKLDLRRSAANATVPISTKITKIIIRGNSYEIGKKDGPVLSEQTITSKDLALVSDANAKQDMTLESIVNSGNPILDLYVPTKDNSGNCLDPQQWHVTVLLFTDMKDTAGTQYFWYEADDVKKVSEAYERLDPDASELNKKMLANRDAKGFPASFTFTLDYNLCDTNPNTGRMSFFDEVVYHFDYDGTPTDPTPTVSCDATSATG